MSTLLVSLAVVAVAVAVCLLGFALSDPDQRATLRPSTSRGRRPSDADGPPNDTDAAAPSEQETSVTTGPTSVEGPDAPSPPAPPDRWRYWRERDRRARASGPWLRLRSALSLVILVTFVGVLLALAVGGALTLAARALRQAVG